MIITVYTSILSLQVVTGSEFDYGGKSILIILQKNMCVKLIKKKQYMDINRGIV